MLRAPFHKSSIVLVSFGVGGHLTSLFTNCSPPSPFVAPVYRPILHWAVCCGSIYRENRHRDRHVGNALLARRIDRVGVRPAGYCRLYLLCLPDSIYPLCCLYFLLSSLCRRCRRPVYIFLFHQIHLPKSTLAISPQVLPLL